MHNKTILFLVLEQKGMTFDHDFGYSFVFPPKKRKKKRRMNSKNHDKK